MKTIWDVIFKGGPGSGRKPTGRKPEVSEARKPKKADSVKLEKFDMSKYRTLNATGRVNMAAKFLNSYKPNYVVKAQQDKATAKLSGYKKSKWMDLNKSIGELEGRRKASIERGNAVKRKERRKRFLMAISYQTAAQVAATIRRDL